MMKRNRHFSYIALIVVLIASAATPQARPRQAKKTQSTSSITSQAVSAAATAPAPVLGGGTTGQIVKWTGGTTVGDSIVTETKSGNIGVGTTTPESKLSVQGMIETTLGGYKFPDGTIQATAFAGKVFTDTTLQGNGTSASPIGIKVPLTLNGNFTVNGFSLLDSFSATFAVVDLLNSGIIRANGDGANEAVDASGGDGVANFPQGGTGVRARGGKGFGTAESGR